MTANAHPESRTVVVTGGCTNIGKAIAESFLRRGDTVVLAARDYERCRTVADLLGVYGRCVPVQCDVTDSESVEAAIDFAWSEAARLDVLVCNAGGTLTQEAFPFSDPEEIRATIEANLFGSLLCAQAAGRRMIPNRRGSMVFVGSAFGILASDPELYRDIDGFAASGPAYHASKAGIHHLTRSLAARLGPFGIRVNCVSPGVVPVKPMPEELRARFTARTPLRRLGTPTDIASAVVFVAGDEASWITGHNLVVDGGWTSQ